MEIWHKYSIQPGEGVVVRSHFAPDFDSQAALMGGYSESAEYESRETFWRKHFQGRYKTWDNFLRKHLDRDARILSIASGRSINELRLLADGYQVTCSDLELPACHRANVKLFGPHEYLALDITKQTPPGEFRAVMCLSLIYLFDGQALDAFFRNISHTLPVGGKLILDAAGSEQSFLGTLYHRGFLKCEAWAHYLLRKVASATPLSRFRYDLTVQQYGYRWKSRELIAMAARHGLQLATSEEYDPETELRRSPLICRILDRPHSLAARVLVAVLGQRLRYLRLFAFTKQP